LKNGRIVTVNNFNADGSETAKIIKGNISQHHIDIYAMHWWVISLFCVIFAVFDPSPLTLWIKLQIFKHLF